MSYMKQWPNYGYLPKNNRNETRDDYSDELTSNEFQEVITVEHNNVAIQHVKSKTICTVLGSAVSQPHFFCFWFSTQTQLWILVNKEAWVQTPFIWVKRFHLNKVRWTDKLSTKKLIILAANRWNYKLKLAPFH